MPKCIVHGAGGTLLQHLKEQRLQCDLRDGDRAVLFHHLRLDDVELARVGLASGATLMLYDGSPFAPDAGGAVGLRRGGADHDLRHLGQVHRLPATRTAWSPPRRTICRRSSSSPRPARRSRPRASITSIARSSPTCIWRRFPAAPTSSAASCSAIPTSPVWKGEIQAPGLGMAVDVWSEDGKPVRDAEGRAGLHPAVPLDADRLLERSRRQEISRAPISSASPTSGATAISPNGPRMTA